MRLDSRLTATFTGFVRAWSVLFAPANVYAQNALPTPDQLDQLLAPIALFPDPLVAQAQGFDPAFIALVDFPQVLDMMVQNIDNYAAIGQAFTADQGMVMDSIQRLRQQAYAVGALQSNEYQTVDVQSQGTPRRWS